MSKYPGRIVTDLAPAGYSVFFDGTGDSLSTASNAAFGFGTGDATIEAWIYPNTVSGTQVLIDTRVGVGVAGVGLYLSNATLSVARDSNNVLMQGGTVAANTWSHVAWTRSGSTNRLFLNGVQTASATDSTNYPTARCFVGSNDGNAQNLNGYISNARVLKGTALYTAAFTPPTQLFNITNTSLLTCNSPAIIDQSSNAFAITANGNAAVSTFTPFTAYVPYNPALGAATPGVWTVDEAMQAAATRQWNMYDPSFNNTTLLLHGNPTNGTSFITDASTNNFTVTPVGDTRAANLSPFSLTTFATSGSAYLDGTGDYINLGGQSAFSFGTGDWTVEFWMNFSATGGTLFDTRPAGTASTNGYSVLFLSSGSVRYDTASGVKITGSTLSANTWYHVALSKASGVTRLFINGVQDGSSYTDSVNYGVGANRPIIGADGNIPTSVLFTGYLSNYRIVKGVGVYTGNFTTPTAPLTATQAAGTNISAITGTQTSLLTLQNSQSANNNAFLDSSSNNFLITRNGNTTQGSFSPFSQTGWSGYMGSSGATVVSIFFNGESDFAFGTGDFTIELWIYLTPSGANQVIYDQRPGLTNGAYPTIYLNNSNTKLSYYVNTADRITQTSTFTYNTWHHVVITRTGTNTKMFVDGVQEGSTYTDSTNYLNGTNRPCTTNGNSNADGALGYLSNLRVVKGSGPYQGASSTITVPTSPLTPVTNTVLLTLQSNRFVDTNTQVAAKTVNVSNNPSVQPFSPFYPTVAYTPQTIGGSGYFDGTGDYLLIPAGSAFAPGTGDFTIEAWVYPTASGDRFIWTQTVSGTNYFVFGFNTTGFLIMTASGGGTNINGPANSILLNSWNHIAAVRSSGTVTVYVNGVGGTPTSNTFDASNTTYVPTIGTYTHAPTTNVFTGYMSSLRYVKGTAVYTGNFTPPIAQVGTSGPASSYSNTTNVNTTFTSTNTSALLNFTNAGVVDSTGKNALETAGDARISTAVSRFGGSSIFFDGTGDWLQGRISDFTRFAGDFTVECWAYASTYSNYNVILDTRTSGVDANGIVFGFNSSGNIYAFTTTFLIQAGTAPANTWNHLAYVRSGSTLTAYLNGVSVGTASLTTNLSSGNMVFGKTNESSSNFFVGYLDDFRITKFARYTGNFTPQTSQWQDQ